MNGDIVKKKVLLIILSSFLLTGVVSAASLWGSYKGNAIIRLTVDGVPTKVSDVPAINYNGRTMVPIYMLQQAGVEYTWDGKNQTVDVVTKKDSPELIDKPSFAQETVKLGDIGVKMYEFLSDGHSVVATYYFKEGLTFNSGENKNQFNQVIEHSLNTEATSTRMVYSDGTEVSVPNKALIDYRDGKMTASELQPFFKFVMP